MARGIAYRGDELESSENGDANRDIGPLTIALDELADRLTSAEYSLGHLVASVAPIMGPEKPTLINSGPKNPETLTVSRVTDRLTELAERVSHLGRLAEETRDRIEL